MCRKAMKTERIANTHAKRDAKRVACLVTYHGIPPSSDDDEVAFPTVEEEPPPAISLSLSLSLSVLRPTPRATKSR